MSREHRRCRRFRERATSRSIVLATGVSLGLLGSGAVVWQGSYAAFSATTANQANSLATGSLSLSDSQGGSSTGGVGTALWSVTGLLPGDTGTKCIKVTYGGSIGLSVSGGVRLYVASGDLTGSLGTYLRLSIDEGTAGASSDCSDFGGTVTNMYNTGGSDNTKTVATFASAHSTWATGVSTWIPTGSGQSRTYRIRWAVLGNNAAVGTSSTVKLSWQAQS